MNRSLALLLLSTAVVSGCRLPQPAPPAPPMPPPAPMRAAAVNAHPYFANVPVLELARAGPLPGRPATAPAQPPRQFAYVDPHGPLPAELDALDVTAGCPIDGARRLGLAATSPGGAATVRVYDIDGRQVVQQAVPVPGARLVTALIQAPGTRLLVGIAVTGGAADSPAARAELFFHDMATCRTLRRVKLEFRLDRGRGQAFVAVPDGSVWACGGGGIVRIWPRELRVEPLARVGGEGRPRLAGRTLYLAGPQGLRQADVSHLITTRSPYSVSREEYPMPE